MTARMADEPAPPMTVRLPPELRAAVAYRAATDGVSPSRLIRDAIRNYVDLPVTWTEPPPRVPLFVQPARAGLFSLEAFDQLDEKWDAHSNAPYYAHEVFHHDDGPARNGLDYRDPIDAIHAARTGQCRLLVLAHDRHQFIDFHETYQVEWFRRASPPNPENVRGMSMHNMRVIVLDGWRGAPRAAELWSRVEFNMLRIGGAPRPPAEPPTVQAAPVVLEMGPTRWIDRVRDWPAVVAWHLTEIRHAESVEAILAWVARKVGR